MIRSWIHSTRHISLSCQTSHYRQYSTSTSHDSLRILFCGSDAFSIASLEALYREHTRNPNLIASINVVCRPPKPTGRGLRAVRQVPILSAARQLSLPVHEVDTFTGWIPPNPASEPLNLIVAVSFGLLIPARIIKGARYGGLNVHPSLLPKYGTFDSVPQWGMNMADIASFRGAAPLYHTLLSGTEVTGVSLQTLHPTKFDHGIVLAQTSPCRHGAQTVAQLETLLAPQGAELLVTGIKDGVFVDHQPRLDYLKTDAAERTALPAPRIVPSDRHIDWQSWTADEILRRHRVIGPLWNMAHPIHAGMGSKPMRLIWPSGFQRSTDHPGYLEYPLLDAGRPIVVGLHSRSPKVYIQTCDDHVLQIDDLKVEGDISRDVLTAAQRAKMIELPNQSKDTPDDVRLFNVTLD